MKNPWEEISLTDYENHMKLDSVMQLQTMNEMMKNQFNAYPVSSAAVFGVAGGNGLEYIQKDKFTKVYGIDINSDYLKEAKKRYSELGEILECLCIDLINETDKLTKADMVIANLLVEYIGYVCFQKAIKQVNPKYISCIIQINIEGNWVSDSPYLHIFDGLEQIHHQMEEQTLEKEMSEIGYHVIDTLEQLLPQHRPAGYPETDFLLGGARSQKGQPHYIHLRTLYNEPAPGSFISLKLFPGLPGF